jgi:hypothetical protein
MAPWVFVLAPLVTLLLVSRPSVRREWIALAVAIPLLVLSLASVGGLFPQFVRASGAMLSGAFVALMLSRPGPVFPRALAATGIAGATILLVGRYLGFGWPEVQASAARETAEFFSGQATAAAAQGAAGEAAKQVFTELAQRAESVASLFPAILILAALAGLALSWRLYQELASRPVPWTAGSFGSFRFGDQLVWVPVLALAALVFPVTDAPGGLSLTIAAQNVLLVSVVLYAMRGLAVFWTVARAAPRAIVLALTLVAVFLSPFAVSGLALLGLADSWVDFRRRVAPPTTGGLNP